MALLTAGALLGSGGGSGAPRWAAIGLQKVTTADTYDMGTGTLPGSLSLFTSVTSALFVATSNRTATTTLGTIAGTVVTMLGAGIAADSGILFVVGE
jgi:hypothetical protein